MTVDRLHVDRRTRMGRDVKHRLLAVFLVWAPDHGGFGDLRKLMDDDFDLARVDVLPAADDHVLVAADQDEVAVLVEASHVAGVQPAVDEGLRSLVGPVEVAAHHVGALDHHLAGLAVGCRAPRSVDHPDRLPRQRKPDSPGLALAVQRVDGLAQVPSDSPYPSMTGIRKRVSKRSSSSALAGAAPQMANRTDDVSGR